MNTMKIRCDTHAILCAFIVCIYFAWTPLAAQDTIRTVELRDSVRMLEGEPSYYFGVFGGLQRWSHETNQLIYKGEVECCQFNTASAIGWQAGLTFDYILVPELLEVSARVAYDMRPFAFYKVYDSLPLSPNEQLEVANRYEGSVGYLTGYAGVNVIPLREIPAYVRVELGATTIIPNSESTQYREIVNEGRVFPETETKTQTLPNGMPLNLGNSLHVAGALGADIPFQPQISIRPEVGYRYPITSMSRDWDWKADAIFASVGLRYEFRDDRYETIQYEHESIEIVWPEDTVRMVEQPVTIVTLDSEPLLVQETVVTQTFPLLPYVFFDSTATEPNDRMQRIEYADDFSTDELVRSTLPTYYNMLNIVGQRLKQYPEATLTVTGTSDGREAGAEQREVLSLARARSIGDYLFQTWGITNQVQIESRSSPSVPSSDQYEEGFEENRRVELFSSDPRILAPVVHSRFDEFDALRTKQQFGVKLNNEQQARSWTLEISFKNRLLKAQTGTGVPPSRLDLPISNEMLEGLGPELATEDSLSATIAVELLDGSSVRASCPVPVHVAQNTFEVSRLSLIVFDFDRSDISELNKKMMEQFVQTAIKDGSMASITGSTDRLGEARHNKELSQARAEAVHSYMQNLVPDFENYTSVKGIGNSYLPFDNNLPEGRFYCRTVTVEIRTPVN